MITKAAFLVLHQEFRNRESLIQAALDEAELRTDAAIFGTLTDQAHRWLAADILASAPDGTGARLNADGAPVPGMRAAPGGISIYAVKRKELEDLVSPLQMAGADADETFYPPWC